MFQAHKHRHWVMPLPSPTTLPELRSSQPCLPPPSTRTPTLMAAMSRAPSRLSLRPTERVCCSKSPSQTCPPPVGLSVCPKITKHTRIKSLTRSNQPRSLPHSRSACPRQRQLHCHSGSPRPISARRDALLRPCHSRDLPSRRSRWQARQG